MTLLKRSQRVFSAVFPPEESPYQPQSVRAEHLRLDQQRLWDVVARVLGPDFSRLSNHEECLTEG